MFETQSLVKRFAGVEVLHDVSLTVARGEILGYLGANGSGKSTTIKIITGLLEATSGRVLLDGVRTDQHPVAFKRRLGYVPEEPTLYTHLTAPEYLRLVGRLRQIPPPRLEAQIENMLRLLDLEAVRGAVMSTFSKGMRQRVLLAAALMHNPDLLVLDEPFSGLDVNASLLLRAVLQALARRRKMILLTSHQLALVETLCPRVVILHRGAIVAEGSPEQLRRTRRTETLEEVFALVTEQENYADRAEAILTAMTEK